MDWLLKHKLIAAAIILGVAAVVWYMMSGPSESPEAVLVAESVEQIPPEAQELLNSLHALQRVTLQSSIFSNQAFQALQDYTTPVIPEPIGRPNPFAPLGGNVTTPSSATP